MNKLVKHITEQKFNFNIDQLDLEDNEGEFSLSKQQYKSKSMKQEYVDNNLFVDLGLPSGTLWCKYNLGCDFALLASNPENTNSNDWYGKYYAWGETEDKNEYSWTSYKYTKNSRYALTKYCTDFDYGFNKFTDNLTELLPEDDVAHQYNSSWKMPTKEQCQELIANTNRKWISGEEDDLYMNVKGLAGKLFISKINGNQIFIPAAGRVCESLLNYTDSDCYLQSSSLTPDDPDDAWCLYFYSDYICMYYGDRCDGQSVRPVLNKNN